MRIGTGVVAAAVALASAVATVMARPASPPTAIVSLGDSFISGEGGGSYGASGRNGCHRSATAPIRSAQIDVDEKVNLACSGAKAVNIWRAVAGGRPHRGEPPQADQLAAVAGRLDVKLVVLTVGANDLGFGAIVAGCALDWARSSPGDPRLCRRDAQRRLEGRLPAVRRGLRKAIREIHAAMATATGSKPRAPRRPAAFDPSAPGRRGAGGKAYRLIVMGYASPLPLGSQIRYPESGWSRLTRGGCPVWNDDADWAKRWALPTIAAMMRSATAAESAEYLNLQPALAGHEVCTRRAPDFDPALGGTKSDWWEWFRPLRLTGRVRESLHPNPLGQRVIGRCLAQAYAEPIPAHKCKS